MGWNMKLAPILVVLAAGCILAGMINDWLLLVITGALLCGVCVVVVHWDMFGPWIEWVWFAAVLCIVWIPLSVGCWVLSKLMGWESPGEWPFDCDEEDDYFYDA